MSHVHPWIAATLRWAGRLSIVLAPLVLASALFWPAGVQWLSPVVCPDGLELSNERDLVGFTRQGEARLELVCTSSSYSETVGQKVVLVAVVLVAVGLALLYVANRVGRPRYHAPADPALH